MSHFPNEVITTAATTTTTILFCLIQRMLFSKKIHEVTWYFRDSFGTFAVCPTVFHTTAKRSTRNSAALRAISVKSCHPPSVLVFWYKPLLKLGVILYATQGMGSHADQWRWSCHWYTSSNIKVKNKKLVSRFCIHVQTVKTLTVHCTTCQKMIVHFILSNYIRLSCWVMFPPSTKSLYQCP